MRRPASFFRGVGARKVVVPNAARKEEEEEEEEKNDDDDDDDDDDAHESFEQKEQQQPVGIDGMTLWFALGFVFDFMTPSSAECRKIIRAAAEQNRVVLKNVSQWRKAQWEKAAKEHVQLRNAHTPLPGCRGYRVCWQASIRDGGECLSLIHI